jgi:hypothetical protein
MTTLKIALAMLGAIASTSASAGVVDVQAKSTGAKASTCYYVGTILTAEATYDVYECYDNGNGSY